MMPDRGWRGLQEFSRAVYKESYFLPGEDYDMWLDRKCRAYQNDKEHGDRMKEYVHNYWFHGSTPVSSNAGVPDRGLPIACYTKSTADTKEGIFQSWIEDMYLGALGGGVGDDKSSVREINSSVGNHGGKSSGIIPFEVVEGSLANAISQGGIRRFSKANYLHVSHPEIMDHINIRVPTGDQSRRAPKLHHAVVIPDSFMDAVITDSNWDLVSPKDGSVVETIKAREIWDRLLEVRATLKGEPYLLFIDTVNRLSPIEYKLDGVEVITSNLCVTGDTKILTSEGYKEIAKLEGTVTSCWNGKEWSDTTIEKTSEAANVLTVKLNNYSEITATHEHKWYVMDGYRKVIEKRTYELEPGDKLIKFDLEPVTHGMVELDNAYENGFHSGDGTIYKNSGKPRISLHDGKKDLFNRFSGYYSTSYTKNGRVLNLHYKKDILRPKFFVPNSQHTVKSRLTWLAGYLDADGTLTNNNGAESIQVASIELEFLQEVLLLLQELGIHSTISLAKEAGYTKLPANDGSGELKEFWCKESYRLLIAGSELYKLLALGFDAGRVQPTSREYQKEARQFVKVLSITDNGEVAPTFCGNEPNEHKLMFNGILTGNCSEITLRTDDEHSGVCCLGSVNAEYYDEWKDHPTFIEDCTDFLDNVLQSFIDIAKTYTEPLKKIAFARVIKGAEDERSIGLGVMGFHSYLQKKNIPWETPMAKAFNIELFTNIQSKADAHNTAVNSPCPMAVRTGSKKRNIHITAVAPTMTISSLCDITSSGIEPWITNAFTKDVNQGSFAITNKYLHRVIEKFANSAEGEVVGMKTHTNKHDWIDAQWTSIKKNNGSVQHLDWMDDWTKDVFKTAFEIDQKWVIELAGDRATLIDQAQSLNLFIVGGSKVQMIGDLHILAWKKGVKSLYYFRSMALDRASTSSTDRKAIQKTEEVDMMSDTCIGCG